MLNQKCLYFIVPAAVMSLSCVAAPVWAQNETSPPSAASPDPALTVTGQGQANIAPMGFYLSISFFNDAIGAETAVAQNEQAESRLRDALVRAGVAAADIHAQNPRAVGAPANNSGYGPAINGVALKPTDTARALRGLSVSGRNVKVLAALVPALQSVGANGMITLSYDYGDSNGLKTQLLKKAVADAMQQAKIMEAAALPRHLSLVKIEQAEFHAPDSQQRLTLTLDKGATPAAFRAPDGYADQSVTLHYGLTPETASTPAALVAKSVAKPAPTKPAKPAPQKK